MYYSFEIYKSKNQYEMKILRIPQRVLTALVAGCQCCPEICVENMFIKKRTHRRIKVKPCITLEESFASNICF